MKITFKNDAMVVLVGAMGTGKSSFASMNFSPHEIVSTDKLRADLTGDFNSQAANSAVFEIVKVMMNERAKAGIFTVVDSTGSGTIVNHAQKCGSQYNRPVYYLVFPELLPYQLTKERMQHRMHVLDIYEKQVNRVKNTTYPAAATVIHMPREELVEVAVEKENTIGMHKFELAPGQHCIVLPDLHGCYSVVQELMTGLPDQKFISLGDIVDRGPSSYLTFQLINMLRKAGRLEAVISNHDNKFYRWCKKYLSHMEKPDANVDVRTFGMQLSDGLEKTVAEFYDVLNKEDRTNYAHDFIEYFDACHPALLFEKGNERHIFVHAGITAAVFTNHRFGKGDTADFMYSAHDNVEEIAAIKNSAVPNSTLKYFIHTGHNYKYNFKERLTFETHASKDGSVVLVEHDVGYGKRVDEYDGGALYELTM